MTSGAAGRTRGYAAVVLALLLVGCGEDSTEPRPGTTRTGSAVPDPDQTTPSSSFLLTFDDSTLAYDGAREFPDTRAQVTGLVRTRNGGRVELVSGAKGQGQAIRFPAVCTAEQDCPRAMVAIDNSAALDPDDADFTYGARVLLPLDQTALGSNIVQKGRFGSTGGQWKLQVDTLDGQPSCVVRGETSLVNVRSPVAIADGSWHALTCAKDDSGVSIDVDGEVTYERGETGAVSNGLRIRIGSPGTGDQDDQFHGVVDDVFLRVDDDSGD